MTQGPTAEAPSPTGAALRFGAVLAASGPVILTAFGVGRRSVGWFCSAPDLAGEGPYALESTPGELLFWAVLLLPVLLAGLLLRGSRRATPAAVAAVGVVLAFGLFTAFFLPGLDPCTARLRAVVPPWPLIVCYPVAAGTLLLAPRPPPARGSAPWTPVLWAGAAGAAAWAAMFHRLPITAGRFEVILYAGNTTQSPWDGLVWWSCDADVIGLPVVLVALAATAGATAPARWGRAFGAATAAVLLLSPLLDLVTYMAQCGDEFPSFLADSVRWNLLVAAGLVAAAIRRPGISVSRAGAVHLVRRSWGRAKDLAVVVVIAAAAVWLVVSSFTPTR